MLLVDLPCNIAKRSSLENENLWAEIQIYIKKRKVSENGYESKIKTYFSLFLIDLTDNDKLKTIIATMYILLCMFTY